MGKQSKRTMFKIGDKENIYIALIPFFTTSKRPKDPCLQYWLARHIVMDYKLYHCNKRNFGEQTHLELSILYWKSMFRQEVCSHYHSLST